MTTRTVTAVFIPGSHLEGALTYERPDHSFRFDVSEPVTWDTSATAALVLGTIQLEVEVSSGRCLYAFGYCPQSAWNEGVHEAVDVVEGRLLAGVSLEPSAGFSLCDPGSTQQTHDPRSGTVRVLIAGTSPSGGVSIAEGVVVLLDCSNAIVGVDLTAQGHL